MEESHQNGSIKNSIKNLPLSTAVTAGLLQNIYTYSTRYIAIPSQQKQKQKLSQPPVDQTLSPNYQYFMELKKQIQQESSQLTQYIDDIQTKLQKVKDQQLNWMGDKYRYYLRKFKKYSNEHQKLLETYQNLDNIIFESAQIQQEMKSIEFIQMVSQDTNAKLNKIRQKVQKAQQRKIDNQNNIKELKDILSSLKEEYFNKKREEANLEEQIATRKNQAEMMQINRSMLKVRQEKKKRLQEMRSTFNSTSSKKGTGFIHNSCASFENQLKKLPVNLNQFSKINKETQRFIQKLSQTCENFKIRKLQEQKKINNSQVNLLNLQTFQSKDKGFKQNKLQKDQDLMTNNEILKQFSVSNRGKENFKEKTVDQVLNIIIKLDKLKEILLLVEEDKKQNRMAKISNQKNSALSKCSKSQTQFYQNKHQRTPITKIL